MATSLRPVQVRGQEILEWFSLFACAVAPLPMVILHLMQLETLPHYECAPVVTIVAIYLLWRRWQAATVPERQFQGAGFVAWLLLLSTLGVAVSGLALASPWLGMVTWIMGLGAMLSRTSLRWCGPWALLWLTLPLPLGLDAKLVQRLQLTSSRWSSHLLDLWNVAHVLEGNVFRLDDRDLFVDEACSGIMSLIAVLATVSILCVVRRRPLILSAPTIFLSGLWALVMNVGRIVICAVAWHGWRLDLVSGIPHEMLGFATFAGAVLLALSSEQLVIFLLGPIQLSEGSSWLQLAELNPLVRLWNWLAGVTLEDSAVTSDVRLRRIRLAGSLCRGVLGLACVLCVLAPVPRLVAAEALREVSISPLITTIDESFLPLQIGPWRRVQFQVDRRPQADVFGEHSKCWYYENRGLTALVSIDYPFLGWHELRSCYTGIGWRHGEEPIDEATWSGSVMRHPTGSTALLLFTLLDAEGRVVEPESREFLRELPHRDLVQRLWDRAWREQSHPARRVTTYQVQVLASWTTGAGRGQPLNVRSAEKEREVVALMDEVKRRVQRLLGPDEGLADRSDSRLEQSP